jgi:hypothetical protein
VTPDHDALRLLIFFVALLCAYLGALSLVALVLVHRDFADDVRRSYRERAAADASRRRSWHT